MTLNLIRGLGASCLLVASVQAGTEYRVTINGEVEFNGISTGPLGAINDGEAASLSFLLDSDDFVNSASFPTRGYIIDQSSWSLDFEGGSVGLQNPFPGTPYFVLRDNDPAVDGFFVADSVNFPTGVPLQVAGAFGQFRNAFSVTYGGSELPSLDIADAVGFYDFTGLSVFNWTIEDGPFQPLGLVFADMTIEEVEAGDVTLYGCGVNPDDSLIFISGDPTLGGTLHFGIDNPLGTQAPGSLPALVVGFGPAPGFPCGVSIPGFGMSGAGASGELLLQLGTNPVIFGGPWAGAGSPSLISVTLPANSGLVGFSVYLQGLMFDMVAAQGVTFGLANAARVVIGE